MPHAARTETAPEVRHGGNPRTGRRPERPGHRDAPGPRRPQRHDPGTRRGPARQRCRERLARVATTRRQPVPPVALHAAALANADAARTAGRAGSVDRLRRLPPERVRPTARHRDRRPARRRRAVRDGDRPAPGPGGSSRNRRAADPRCLDPPRCQGHRIAHRARNHRSGTTRDRCRDRRRRSTPCRSRRRRDRPAVAGRRDDRVRRRPPPPRGARGFGIRVLRPPLPFDRRVPSRGPWPTAPALRQPVGPDPSRGQQHVGRRVHHVRPGQAVARAARRLCLAGRAEALPDRRPVGRGRPDHRRPGDLRYRGPLPPVRCRRRTGGHRARRDRRRVGVHQPVARARRVDRDAARLRTPRSAPRRRPGPAGEARTPVRRDHREHCHPAVPDDPRLRSAPPERDRRRCGRRDLPDIRRELGDDQSAVRGGAPRSRRTACLRVRRVDALHSPEALAAPGMVAKVLTLGANAPQYPTPGPNRAELLATIATAR